MSLIRVGSFPGRWHGDPVSFLVQQVFGGGQFNGVATFTGGPHQGVQFGFTGAASGSGGLSVVRQVAPGFNQHASDATFEIANNEIVWRGLTTGVGIGAPGLPFEVRLPSLTKPGTFAGQWHGDPVSFNFQQVYGGGQFNGVAAFTGGSHQGTQFGFSGYLTGNGGIFVSRGIGPGTQSAFDVDPQIVNGHCIWQALTTGVGIESGPGLHVADPGVRVPAWRRSSQTPNRRMHGSGGYGRAVWWPFARRPVMRVAECRVVAMCFLLLAAFINTGE